MIKSMTGFGYREFLYKKRKISISLKSLNSKYCDVYLNLPSSFNEDESVINDIIKKYINRGKIELSIYIENNNSSADSYSLDINYKVLDEYIKAAAKIKKRYNIKDEFKLSDIFRLNIFNLKQQNEKIRFNKKIEQELLKVVKKVLKMREEEGKNLAKSISVILGQLKEHLSYINKKKGVIIKDYEKRLHNKIKNLIDKSKYDENRILMEVTLLADKLDITEEIERMKSHIIQIKNSIRSNIPVGRKLEFILQEMLREVNTIGSKISDVEITKKVISMKENIDTLREQIRNIE